MTSVVELCQGSSRILLRVVSIVRENPGIKSPLYAVTAGDDYAMLPGFNEFII